MAITVFPSRSPGLVNRGPRDPLCWVLVFSIASYLELVWSPTDWTSCAPSYIIIWRPLFLWVSQIALIQLVHGQGNILLFLDRMHLLFTQVHFLFWQPGRVGGQYKTPVNVSIYLCVSLSLYIYIYTLEKYIYIYIYIYAFQACRWPHFWTSGKN